MYKITQDPKNKNNLEGGKEKETTHRHNIITLHKWIKQHYIEGEENQNKKDQWNKIESPDITLHINMDINLRKQRANNGEKFPSTYGAGKIVHSHTKNKARPLYHNSKHKIGFKNLSGSWRYKVYKIKHRHSLHNCLVITLKTIPTKEKIKARTYFNVTTLAKLQNKLQ